MDNLSALAPWFAVAVSIFSLLYSVFNGRSKDSQAKFENHALKIDKVEDRVSRIENELEHLPDKEVTHRLELALAEMRTEVRGLSEQMRPLNAIATRIQDGIFEKAGIL